MMYTAIQRGQILWPGQYYTGMFDFAKVLAAKTPLKHPCQRRIASGKSPERKRQWKTKRRQERRRFFFAINYRRPLPKSRKTTNTTRIWSRPCVYCREIFDSSRAKSLTQEGYCWKGGDGWPGENRTTTNSRWAL